MGSRWYPCGCIALLVAGCLHSFSTEPNDAGADGGPAGDGGPADAGVDGGFDAGSDAGLDAGTDGGDAGFDAGLICGIEVQAIDFEELYAGLLPAGASDVAIAPDGQGGYVVGAVVSLTGTQFVDVSLDGAVSDAGFLACGQSPPDVGDCPFETLSLITLDPKKPPTLVAGYEPAGQEGSYVSAYACWTPFNHAGPTGSAIDLSSLDSSFTFEVALVRAAYLGGLLAAVVTDLSDGADWVTMDPSIGTCPNDGAQLQTSNALGDAIAPSLAPAMSPFEVAVVTGNADTLSVYSLPDGGGAQIQLPIKAKTLSPPAVAADGTVVTTLVADDQKGVQLFTNAIDQFDGIVDGTSLAPPTATGLSAANCGPGCTLGAWMQQSDAGILTPMYAFISPRGAVQQGALQQYGSYVTTPPPTTAVAYQPGSAAVAYVFSDLYQCGNPGGCATESHVRVSLCRPR
ncbi:MAG: hypothetical protein ACYDCL_03375 [Myxococcales bacterium]